MKPVLFLLPALTTGVVIAASVPATALNLVPLLDALSRPREVYVVPVPQYAPPPVYVQPGPRIDVRGLPLACYHVLRAKLGYQPFSIHRTRFAGQSYQYFEFNTTLTAFYGYNGNEPSNLVAVSLYHVDSNTCSVSFRPLF